MQTYMTQKYILGSISLKWNMPVHFFIIITFDILHPEYLNFSAERGKKNLWCRNYTTITVNTLSSYSNLSRVVGLVLESSSLLDDTLYFNLLFV